MTREEAINEVKKAMPTMWKETKEALSILIPELAESEDDKIKKSLVEYFSSFKPTDMWNNLFSFSQIVAYLEKKKEQKEQKEQDKCPEYCVRSHCMGCPIYEKQKEQIPSEFCDAICCEDDRFKIIGEAKKDIIEKTNIAENELSMELPLLDCILMRVWQVGWLNKKQKPTHTAKEMWKEMRHEVYTQASGNRHEPNCSDDSTKMFSLCDIDEIFEKIGNSTVGSQIPEWSKEDERMLNQLIYDVEYNKKEGLISAKKYKVTEALYNGIEKCYDEKIAWLKSLRPQPKQD